MNKKTDTTEDKIIKTINIYETFDYEKFKHVSGNRKVDPVHVKGLVRSFRENGNLMPDEPAEVDKDFYLYDGQNRLDACRELGYPFYYKFVENVTTDNMRVRNSYRKNWGWRDYMYSYANDIHKSAQVRKSYQAFVYLAENFKENYGILLTYCGYLNVHSKADTKFFYDGDLKIEYEIFERAKMLLQQCHEIVRAAHVSGQVRRREFFMAAYKVMTHVTYNHDKMRDQIPGHRSNILNCVTQRDYELTLKAIINS